MKTKTEGEREKSREAEAERQTTEMLIETGMELTRSREGSKRSEISRRHHFGAAGRWESKGRQGRGQDRFAR